MITSLVRLLAGAGVAPYALACDINPKACAATLATATANSADFAVDVVNCDLLAGVVERLQVDPPLCVCLCVYSCVCAIPLCGMYVFLLVCTCVRF